MVTLNDIAKMANVSKSTVSRYLNNGSVSQKTREKLDEIVQQTGYQPNLLAQSLKAQKSNMVGVIIPRYGSPSTNEVLKGIDTIAYAEDIQLMIMNSDLDIERTKKNLRLLQRQKVGVIILLATAIDKELEEQLKTSKTPILLVGQKLAGLPSYVYKDYEAGRLIAEHAIQLGHKKLLFVGVSEEDYAVGVLRKKGFYDVAKQNGAEISFIQTNFSRSKNYEKALEFLPKTQATYIAAATDLMAIGIFNACMELGIQIPHQISLSGFGGYNETRNVLPHITTIQYSHSGMGEAVMKAAIQTLETGENSLNTEWPVQLLIQGSTEELKD
ncbi:MAG TPA: LacI family DNA-binding transcriptional regulator [Candidatus Atopostipes pullistercoris]|uniref:LacI family DNA-binding transcriptional regulator n=1 Tax=Candidatus Atopostipes pullistercoris TaxID=2838467 RepID=A0A9D2JXS0_9LACT|nr:LacI family DNA-binding transcriptional regulator [Candidatus Atopostipes pullistercoris]